MYNLVSKECVEYVKGIEGFEPKPKKDMVGVLTLGYGMTGKEIEGIKSITEAKASEMLVTLLENNYANPIHRNLESRGIYLNQNQFDALVSFAYNLGVGALLGSTLYKNVCGGRIDRSTIMANFQAWDMAGGKHVEGLHRRRTAEAEMFLKSVKPAYQERYVRLFQEFFNEATQTKPSLTVDGDAGKLTMDAYNILGRLIKGVY
jgi:lysozyme